jgi:ElaB/YqjD/DUF883 family membrane-anchored ribosome-binding protein
LAGYKIKTTIFLFDGKVFALDAMIPTLKGMPNMQNLQKLELMDKIQRELEDLHNSQTSVLKKVSQIAADNITLGLALIDEKLPELQDEVDTSLTVIKDLSEAFAAHRDKFFTDNNLAAEVDPTA